MMTGVRVFLSRALDLLLGRRRDARLSEEMQTHLELLTEEYVAAGMPPADAHDAALRAFGGVDRAKRLHREQRGLPWLDSLGQDLRLAARLLIKDRRFTLAAVAALGLGIGVTNTVFTLFNSAALKDLPFDEPDRLISAQSQNARGQAQPTSYADYRDWSAAASTLTGLAASAAGPMNLSDTDRAPDRLRGAYVSANAFSLLRVRPVLGREFLATDDQPGAPPVAIVSYGVWQARYGGDTALIGRSVRINDVPATIIGIMPAGFGFPAFQDLWQPLALLPGLDRARRDARALSVFGRLTDTADLAAARTEIAAVSTRLAAEYPDTNNETTVSVVELRTRLPGSGPMLPMAIAVTFVLLIACANVANLLLARSVGRAREIAIRASLGATRWRIVRQLLIECTVVAALAGSLGLVLSLYGVRLLGVAFDAIDVAAPGQSNTPYWVDLSMDAPVFLFVTALCLATGLAFGLMPALHLAKTDVHETLKDGGRGGIGGRRARRWTGAFVTAELALTLVLLTGTGLLWRNFLTMYRAERVIDVADLVTMRIGLPANKYATPAEVRRFYTALDERLAARPDVLRATLGSYIPYSTFLSSAPQGSARTAAIANQAAIEHAAPPSVWYVSAGPRYFETIGLPIVRGRALTAADREAARAGALIDQRFATMFFADGDPLGQRIRLSSPGAQAAPSPWFTIVGVVPTLEQFGPGRPADPVVYASLGLEDAPRNIGIIARRSTDAERAGGGRRRIGEDPQLASIVSAIRDDVRALDADLPVFAVETMDAALARSRFSNRLIGTWFAMLAGIALVLAAVGLYAMTAHSVAGRRQEIGVRMALGAQAGQVIWLFVRRVVVQLAIGLTFGIAGALAIGQLLQGLLPRTDPRDGPTLLLVCLVLTVVSLAACLLPARRAARLDPMIALREE